MTTVYVASAWWRDCDPFVAVVALTPERAESCIDSAVKQAAQDAFEGNEPEDTRTADDYVDDIAWSGVHAEVLEDMELNSEQMQDLRRDGNVWLDTP